MPTPRNSFAQAELKGTAQQNAGRYAARQNAPVTVGEVGEPPKRLKAAQKKAWMEVVQSIPAGVAGFSDRPLIELASRLLAQSWSDPDMQTSRANLLRSCLSDLGCSPQARTKLQVTPTEQKKETSAIDRFNAARSHGSSSIQ